jgi:putative FmdB family regulatory protein
MPIYEYKCKKGHVFEVMQSFSDDPLTKCQVCGAPVQKVFHPVSVHFKGSGFYNTDYGTKRRAREAKEGGEAKQGKESTSTSTDGGGSSGEGKGESAKSDSGKSSASDSKAAAA